MSSACPRTTVSGVRRSCAAADRNSSLSRAASSRPAELTRLGGERPRLQQHRGLVGEQLEQPQVVLDEDGCPLRVDGQDAHSAAVGRDRRGDHGARPGTLVHRRVLRVGTNRIHRDHAALCHERAPADERVVRVLQPLPAAVDVAQDGPVGIGDADRGTGCAERVRRSLLELRDGLAIVGHAGEVDRALEEGAEIGLSPRPPNPRRRREAKEEGEHRHEGRELDQHVERRLRRSAPARRTSASTMAAMNRAAPTATAVMRRRVMPRVRPASRANAIAA